MSYPKHAHSAIVCGATGCGKSEFVLDLLETAYLGFFEYIVIVCPTWRNNKAYLSRKWIQNEQIFLVDPLDWFPNSDDPMNDALKTFFEVFGKMSQEGQVLFLVDDCSANKSMTKKRQMLSELAFSGRHFNCSVWVLTQKYNSILTDLREQTKWTALFFCKDRDSFDKCLRENDVIPTAGKKKQMKKKLAEHKHSKLILVTEQPTSYRWLE